MKINRLISVGLLTFLVSACTPGDVEYCRGFGVEGTTEYGKCLDHYHTQQAWFNADLQVCNIEADGTYPSSLYDTGHDVFVHGGYGPYGRWHSGSIERVPPDYYHNRQVDDLRMRIIAPCMQARGWNSPTGWQAGRHAVSKAKPLPAVKKVQQKMPWQ